jgi:DNA-binding LacI/PurR family transcriptional regulator
MAAVTIRDVARRANVGIATVSRVINESPAVSEETRQKVLEAIHELDYTPNPIAQRLSLGRTFTIGVISPFLTLPSYTQRLRGIQHAIADSEYDLVLFSVGSPDQRDYYFDRLSRKSQVDGLVIISLTPSQEQALRFVESNIPVVLVDADHPDMCRIIVDDVVGGQRATEHLISLGHRKIAFVSDKLESEFNFQAMPNRYTGYRKALDKADILFKPSYQLQGKIGGINAYNIAREMLTSSDPPTAVFAANDTYAIGVLKAAQELNINIPEDLSVIGFDDIRDAEYLGITTMRQPLFKSGVEGIDLLLSSLKNGCQTALEIKLPTEIVLRRTTAPP